MVYSNIVEGIFIKRLNRFIAKVKVKNIVHEVHVKNTGRCKELLIEGVKVYLQESDNPERKTKYSLISVLKSNVLINIDSQVPNNVVFEAIKSNLIKEVKNVTYIKKEVTYKNSRFDIYYETETDKGFIEVKGVTLEKDGIAMFPDAPTKRGTKHLNELIESKKEGYKSYIFFLIQLKGCKFFKPNTETDILFSNTLKECDENNVNILCYDSFVSKDEIKINKEIEVHLYD